jgi:hypothetical protein
VAVDNAPAVIVIALDAVEEDALLLHDRQDDGLARLLVARAVLIAADLLNLLLEETPLAGVIDKLAVAQPLVTLKFIWIATQTDRT